MERNRGEGPCSVRWTVEIDDREPADLEQALLQYPEVQVLRKRLAIGDFRWMDRLLVERKTLRDLLASIDDRRLFRQVHRMRRIAGSVCLLIEGTLPLSRMHPCRRKGVQGALIHVSLVQGVPILRSRDACESAWLMVRAVRQLARGGPCRRPALRGGIQRHAKQRLQHHVLEGIPGVGPERADHLLTRFGSIAAITQASEDDLRSVPGIGKDLAQRVRWLVSETQCSYVPG